MAAKPALASVSDTENPEAQPEQAVTSRGTVRQRAPFKRGPMQVAIRVKVYDASGNEMPDARVEVLEYSRDLINIAKQITRGGGKVDGQYVFLDIPLSNQDTATA